MEESKEDLHNILIDGISQFINGTDFLTRVSHFIDTNCSMFEDDEQGYTPGQFAIWKEFTSIVNAMLETTLKNLGCSDVKDFVVALEDPAVRTSPRTIAVIDSLKSIDDFIQFHDNMVGRNAELERLENVQVEQPTQTVMQTVTKCAPLTPSPASTPIQLQRQQRTKKSPKVRNSNMNVIGTR